VMAKTSHPVMLLSVLKEVIVRLSSKKY
jgi:hypothetical protein